MSLVLPDGVVCAMAAVLKTASIAIGAKEVILYNGLIRASHSLSFMLCHTSDWTPRHPPHAFQATCISKSMLITRRIGIATRQWRLMSVNQIEGADRVVGTKGISL